MDWAQRAAGQPVETGNGLALEGFQKLEAPENVQPFAFGKRYALGESHADCCRLEGAAVGRIETTLT